MAFPANYPFICSLPSRDGHNVRHASGCDSVFLVGLAGPNGIPAPSSQLYVKREEISQGRMTFVTEIAKRGSGRAVREIARRSYEHPKYARSADRQKARDAATWRSPTGTEVRVWCNMVCVTEAKQLGFKVASYVKPARAGTRTVGYENAADARPVLDPIAESVTPVTVDAVPPTTFPRATDVIEAFRKLDTAEVPVSGTITREVDGVRSVDLDDSKPETEVNPDPGFNPRPLELD